MKYKKIGQGKVLKCWENKIQRIYQGQVEDDSLTCSECGNEIGKIPDTSGENYVKMNGDSFTYTGTKVDK